MHCVRDVSSGGTRMYVEFEYRRILCPRCKAVKQETLTWLAAGGRFTQRLEDEVGRQCQDMTVKRVAEIYHLGWEQTWRMDKAYMQRKVSRNPIADDLRAIGIDEISVRKRHKYRVTVSDLDVPRPIWMGGTGRAEEDLDLFFVELGPERCQKIQIAVMDMWKPFRKAVLKHVPHARIVFDKFHVLRHLSDALDEVRREEVKRVNEKERKFIKGQRYTLLSNRANLSPDGRRSLKLLWNANKRLHKAYLLKESFGQLWDYYYPASARKFFENWMAQLRWQRLKPFEEFAEMIDRHWDGIVSYCHPENKVSLGFVEGLNTKIRVIQRRAYGIKDPDYLRLKVLTSFMPDNP
jgi:transposase